jgi:hypothetical protein
MMPTIANMDGIIQQNLHIANVGAYCTVFCTIRV